MFCLRTFSQLGSSAVWGSNWFVAEVPTSTSAWFICFFCLILFHVDGFELVLRYLAGFTSEIINAFCWRRTFACYFFLFFSFYFCQTFFIFLNIMINRILWWSHCQPIFGRRLKISFLNIPWQLWLFMSNRQTDLVYLDFGRILLWILYNRGLWAWSKSIGRLDLYCKVLLFNRCLGRRWKLNFGLIRWNLFLKVREFILQRVIIF